MASTGGIHRCCQACRQKLLAPSHPSHAILQMVSSQAHFSNWHNFSSVVLAPGRTIRRSPGFLHLGNCVQPMHSADPSSPSAQVQVQFLFCISLRRLHEMLEAVSESSNSLVLHAPSSFSSLWALQSQSHLWIDTVGSKRLPHQECLIPGHTSTLPQPNTTGQYNSGNSASHNRPRHLSSLPQQQKLIHEVNTSQPSSLSFFFVGITRRVFYERVIKLNDRNMFRVP